MTRDWVRYQLHADDPHPLHAWASLWLGLLGLIVALALLD